VQPRKIWEWIPFELETKESSLSQENYLKKVVENFNIPNISNYLIKITSVPFASQFKLSNVTDVSEIDI
jgi:hypothetical protein